MATPWLGIEYIVDTPTQFWNGELRPGCSGVFQADGMRPTELEDALTVPPTPSLEQIDLALRTFVYFCARYYRE